MAKFNVYFQNQRGQERIIGTAEDKAEFISLECVNNLSNSFNIIKDFLKQHNFTSYYYNMHVTPNGRLWVDVGSHTEFFFIEKEG